MKSLAVLGAGGHAKVVADAAIYSGWKNITFFDDRWPNFHQNGMLKISGSTESFLKSSSEFDGVIIAIGDNATRLEKITYCVNKNIPLATIIHPTAVISPSATIGQGTVIFAKAILNSDCTVGLGSIINTGAIVEHDCLLGRAVHIAPGASLGGGVQIGDLSWIGIGSSIQHNVIIGSRTIVGAGTAVINDLPDNYTAFATPANIFR